MFRAQLMRVDIARLEKLVALAGECGDLAEFKQRGFIIGWTQNDMMTQLIAEPLGELLEAVFKFQTGASTGK